MDWKASDVIALVSVLGSFIAAYVTALRSLLDVREQRRRVRQLAEAERREERINALVPMRAFLQDVRPEHNLLRTWPEWQLEFREARGSLLRVAMARAELRGDAEGCLDAAQEAIQASIDNRGDDYRSKWEDAKRLLDAIADELSRDGEAAERALSDGRLLSRRLTGGTGAGGAHRLVRPGTIG